ncbi:MAG: DUF4065 domain-containing protein [Planctomycetota bacterium]|nr:DUF4065 domain-containing protein [Planctomycetota bacterium]
MPFTSKAIANFFLDLAADDPDGLSPMKLQKLVYFAHGWHLAITGKPLINEQIEAWKYGPVIQSLFHEFKEFGAERIDRCARDWKGNVPKVAKNSGNHFVQALLRKVWREYGKFSATKLSNMTHQPGTP